jgi:hypothetical protein
VGAVRAAAKVAAPEVAVVAGAAGAARRGGRAPVPDPRKAAPGSKAATQRQAIEDLKANRPAPSPSSSGDGADPADPSPPAPATPAPAGVSLPSVPGLSSGAAQTGSGFVLGLFFWGWVALPYLRGGAPEVRKTLLAKFLNKTGV